MRKILILLLMVFVLTGCTKQKEEKQPAPAVAVITETDNKEMIAEITEGVAVPQSQIDGLGAYNAEAYTALELVEKTKGAELIFCNVKKIKYFDYSKDGYTDELEVGDKTPKQIISHIIEGSVFRIDYDDTVTNHIAIQTSEAEYGLTFNETEDGLCVTYVSTPKGFYLFYDGKEVTGCSCGCGNEDPADCGNGCSGCNDEEHCENGCEDGCDSSCMCEKDENGNCLKGEDCECCNSKKGETE